MTTKDGPLLTVLIAVGFGAALGAMLRWALSYALNSRLGWLPAGTLAANLIGCFLIGVLAALFSSMPAVPPVVRLFLVTGFLGGLTTFSTFSAEAAALLGSGAYARAALHMALHGAGGLLMTASGLTLGRMLGKSLLG